MDRYTVRPAIDGHPMNAPPLSFSVSVPGSLMLMGEHAVLHGHPALAMAVEPRMTLRFQVREDDRIHVTSEMGTLEGARDHLPESEALRFVRQALMTLPPVTGCDISITSELDATRGWGSSAAVTVGMVAGLRHLNRMEGSRMEIATQARNIIRTVQGSGSGSDAAASTFGGIVKVLTDPYEVEPVPGHMEFSMAYAGYKTPTPEVIRQVEDLWKEQPEEQAQIFEEMEHTLKEMVRGLGEGTLDRLGPLLDAHHDLQRRLGTSDETLEHLVHAFRSHPDVQGAKISGSGIGDSVIALGTTSATIEGYTCDPVHLSPTGVEIYE